jgi:hypothetical protein
LRVVSEPFLSIFNGLRFFLGKRCDTLVFL